MGKQALITGASSGIGLEFAKVLAREGFDLVITARRLDILISLKHELESKHDAKVEIFEGDLSDPRFPKKLFYDLKSKNIRIDVLINNAGFGDTGFFHDSDLDKQKRMLQVNVVALTELTHLFVKEMLTNNSGKILNVASTASFQPGPLMAVYYATKAYVLHFTEAIANELKGRKVSVTALCPGPTTSGFQEVASMQKSRMVNLIKLPSSKEVAEYGYRSMMKGRTLAIHGTLNRIVTFSVRFLPRKLSTFIARSLQENK